MTWSSLDFRNITNKRFCQTSFVQERRTNQRQKSVTIARSSGEWDDYRWFESVPLPEFFSQSSTTAKGTRRRRRADSTLTTLQDESLRIQQDLSKVISQRHYPSPSHVRRCPSATILRAKPASAGLYSKSCNVESATHWGRGKWIPWPDFHHWRSLGDWERCYCSMI